MEPTPSAIEELMATCVARHRDGDLEGAKAGYLEVLQADPEHPQALNFLGTIDAQLGHLDDAERLIRRAISADSQQAGFYNNLGTVLRERGDHTGAIQAYQQALRIDGQLADAYSNLGASQIDTGDTQAALLTLQSALDIAPDFAPLHNNLGRAYNNLGDLDQAESAFKEAIRLQPNFAQAQNNLGHVFRAQNRFVEAGASFQAAVHSNPKHVEAFRNLGTVLMARQLPEEAIEAFKDSLRLEPNDVPTLLNLGVVFHTIGKIGNAITCYKEAVNHDPNNALAHLNFGVLLAEQRQVKHAEQAFRRAIAIDPSYVDAYAELADLYLELGELDKLEELLERGLALVPDHPQLSLEFARFSRLRGHPQTSIDTLAKFDVDSFPVGLRQQYHYELGYLNDRLDNPEIAMMHWDQANKLASKSLRGSNVRAQRYLDKVDSLTHFMQASDPSQWTRNDRPDNDRPPVFLIGFPQSGVNLTHRLLSAYGQLEILNESPSLSRVEELLTHGKYSYPSCLKINDTALWRSMMQTYFSVIGEQVGSNKIPIDKFALRTIHVGLIWRLFPNAKLIFVARHPCETVMNAFMGHQVLNDSTASFFDLPSVVRLYDKVMSLWRVYNEKLDINCHVVRFEELLRGDAAVADMLSFLDLDSISNSAKFASTPFRTGISFSETNEPCWPRYSDYLEPFKETLTPHIEYLGY